MPTTREFLGDSLIKELEGAGFSPESINTFARNEYRQRKAAQEDKLRRLEYKADDMGLEGRAREALLRGEISEEEARNAQKFKEIGSIRHGWGLGGAKTVVGDVDAVERVSDFVNPFYEGQRDEKGNYVYQNAIEKGLRPKIKSAEKLRDDYEKVTGETAWGSRIMEGITQIAGDPINFVGGMGLLSKGSKLAQFGKKSLFFAGTGAASGGVMALGEGKNDEETLKNMGYGAAGGFVLGHAIDQGIQGIGKLIAKRRASRAANEADAVSEAENSDFLRATDDLGGSEIKAADGNSDATRRGADEAVNTESSARGGVLQRGAGDEIPARKDGLSSSAEIMTAREFATSEAGLDEATAAKVVKEAAQGKEKSDFVDADTYADIVKFKNFENQRDYARAYGEQIEAAKQSLESAREQSAARYAQTQKAINEYQKQGMSVSATRELINAKFKPGADEISYTRAYNDGADVDPRLAGQGIFYAIEKDIAGQAYTPEIYAARLKQRGFSDESAQAFTQAYVQKDINIAKEYANGKVAEVYDEQIRKNLTREFEINAKNGVNINKDEAYRQHPMIRPDEPSIEQGGLKRDKLTVAREKLASEINIDKLNDEQKDVYDVFIGNKDKVTLQGKDLNDLYMLERGSRNAGVKKIMIKHAGIEKTGGLTNEELLGIMDVVRGGRIAEDSFEQFSDRIRYAYDLKENGVKFRVVIDEYNDGKKVFDYYSDRNFVDYQQDRRGLARTFDPHSRVQVPSATDEIISQKGNLVNEAETNGLRNSVSSIGDNASRAGGRQAGDEQILRQGRRDTANASQTKRPAQSDEQVEQQWAAKADGEVDAAATGEQVVEKQGSGDNKVARSFTIDDSINKKLNFINENNLGKEGWLDKLNAVIKKYDLKEAETKNEFMGVMIRDRFKYGREFDFPSINGVMPKISPLKPQYHEILNGAHKELNEILNNKTIPATREQNLKFHAANSNAHLGSGLVAGTLNSVDEDGNFSPERFAAGFLTGLVGSKAVATGLRKMTPKLYNQILGAAEKMPQMANGNPRLLGKLYSNGKDVSLNSFAGEKAITANVGKLDQAKAMLEKGADEAEIWQKTGWFKDKDGAWKFEIGDSNAKLNPGFQSGGRLGELLDHKELFKAYPELKDVRVVKIGDEIPSGVALSVKDAAQREKRGIYNVTYNDKTATLVRQDLDDINSALLYERGDKEVGAKHTRIRHLRDENKVGYVKDTELLNLGENIRAFIKKYEEPFIDKRGARIYEWQDENGVRFRAVVDNRRGNGQTPPPASESIITFYSDRNLKDRMDFKNPKVKYDVNLNEWHKDSAQIKHVKNDGNFSDSPNIYKSGKEGYYSPAKNEIGLRDIGDKSTLMHEVQHAIQEIEDFARGGNMAEAHSYLLGKEGRKYEQELKGIDKTLSNLSLEAQHMRMRYGEIPQDVREYEDAKELFRAIENREKAYAELSVLRDDLYKKLFEIDKKIRLQDIRETYRKIHGEAEARNVESRLNLDGKAHPHETFDVNPNETIVSKEDGISYSRKIEEIKREHPNVEKELDESIVAMNKESFNDVNFKTQLLNKFNSKEITTQELGKSVNLSGKQLAVLKNDIKNADFKVINESKIYFDKIGKDGDKKRFFVDIAEDGSLRVDGYSKKDIDSIPVKQSALEELAGTGDAARLKNMSFEVKAAYRNELDPIKKEAILKTAELNKLKKAAQGGDKAAAAKFEEFKAKNLGKNGNIKDGLSLC